MPDAPPCPHCGYSLEGCKPVRGSLCCPECGEQFSFDTSGLRLPFAPLLIATVGLQCASLIALSMLPRASSASVMVGCFYFVVMVAAPAAFAVLWAHRWQEPWRTAVMIRYLVAGYALSVVAFGVSIFALGVVSRLLG